MGVLFVCLCTTCVPGTHRSQKRALVLLSLELDSCELPCGCWELKLGPLAEDLMLFTESSIISPDPR